MLGLGVSAPAPRAVPRGASESIICSGDHRKNRRSSLSSSSKIKRSFVTWSRVTRAKQERESLLSSAAAAAAAVSQPASSPARQAQQPSKGDNGGAAVSGGGGSNTSCVREKTDGFRDRVLRCAHGLQHLGIPRVNLG